MNRAPLTIAVDVDEVCANMLEGVCASYRNAWKNVLRNGSRLTYCGEEVPEISRSILPEDIRGWDLNKYFGKTWWEVLKRDDFYPSVIPMDGARAGVTRLWAAGHRVIYVTSCIPGTADAKQQWLLKWGFLTDKNAMRDFFAVSDKSLVKADVLFDDAVHNVEPFPGSAYLVNHWHNSGMDCTRPRVQGLYHAIDVLRRDGLSD